MIITKSSLNITSESEERVSAPYTFFKLWDNLLVWYDERESAYQFLKKKKQPPRTRWLWKNTKTIHSR